jgi:predicted DNA-binding protein with PD1-like motif
VAELWKFWRMEHLKHTTNKINVAILAEAEDVIRQIKEFANNEQIDSIHGPADNYK